MARGSRLFAVENGRVNVYHSCVEEEGILDTTDWIKAVPLGSEV